MAHEVLGVTDIDHVFLEIEQKLKRLRSESVSRRWVGNPDLAYRAGAAQYAGMVAEEALFRFRAELLTMISQADHGQIISDGMGDADTCRLMAAALRAEREACAVAAATWERDDPGLHETYADGRRAAAEKILARATP